MGYYIMPNSRYGEGAYVEKIKDEGKAQVIADEFEGDVLSFAPKYQEATRRGYGIVVVTDTGEFERAQFANSEEEYANLTDPSDTRPKKYVVLRREMAEEVSVYRPD